MTALSTGHRCVLHIAFTIAADNPSHGAKGAFNVRGLGLIATILVAVLVGVAGYRIGISQSIAQGGVPVVAPIGYYYHPFVFGFLGLLFPLLFFFLVFGVLRSLFWRGWGGGWHSYGPRRPDAAPPMFEEWHRRMHGERPPDQRA